MVEVARGGDGFAEIGLKFLENVEKRGGKGDAFVDGKTKSVGLIWSMVGVLTQDDDLNVWERTEVKGAEDVFGVRINGALLVFGFDKGGEGGEVGGGEFWFET